MRLPAIPFLTKSVATEYFLALIFESDKVSSILFKEQEKALDILASNEVSLDLEGASVEDLVVACDQVVSKLEMSIPEGANLEKTIFAVPHSWVEEGRIKQERLNQLKKISVELALTPMGFIVSIEAIVAFLQKKEGAPVSGVFVELSEKFLTVFIVRSGNIIDIKHGVVEESVEKTVEKLLGEVTKLDVLPSKIVLLHNKEAEAVSQKFLAHHWTKELPFMHLPQVAILEKGFENEAIISGVATQLNVTVQDGVNVGTAEEVETLSAPISQSEDSFGFVLDQDVGSKKEEPKKEEKGPVIKHNGIEGFEEGGEEVLEDEPSEEEVSKSRAAGVGITAALANFFTPQTFSNLFKAVGGGRKLIAPLIALLCVIAVIVLYYSVFLKAKVILFTDKKAFKEDSLAISLTSQGESSFEDKTLKISTIDEEVTGEEQQETTGQKDTGKKAQGSVTIFNKTDSSKTLASGTKLISSNNLEFTLDDEVKISSTSSFSTTFSNSKADITASNFGKEYNLPSQTNFTIKGVSTSDLFAKNDSAFSGGTKEEIQVVAQKDLTGLESTVTKRLFDKAKSEAEKSLSSDDALIPNYLSADFKEKKFDKKLDDTAKSVKLDATVTYTLGVYKKEELTKFIASSKEFDVPADFKLSDADSSISVSDIKQNKNDISAKLSFNAVFKPQLDEKKLPKLIAGKGEKDAESKLKQTPGISDVAIQFQNKLPILPLIVPLNEGNISFELKSQ